MEEEQNQKPIGFQWPLDSVTQGVLRRWLNQEGYLTGTLGVTVVELTDGSSVATDASLGDVFTLTTTQNFTMSNPTNPTNGQIIIYKIKQDSGGSNVITWGSNFRGSTDVPLPALTTTGNNVDYIMFIYDSAVTKWNCLAYNLGFAT